MILLDTNVVARMTNSADASYATARRSVQLLLERRERLVVFPQVLYEFWAIATRRSGPAPGGQNGLGMTPEQAAHWVGFLQRRFVLLHDRPDLVGRWAELVRTGGVTGVHSHDVRLVAAMQSHSVPKILTFNGSDFGGFPVEVMDPRTVG